MHLIASQNPVAYVREPPLRHNAGSLFILTISHSYTALAKVFAQSITAFISKEISINCVPHASPVCPAF